MSTYVKRDGAWVSLSRSLAQRGDASFPQLETHQIGPSNSHFDYSLQPEGKQVLGILHTNARTQQEFVSNSKADLLARPEILTATRQPLQGQRGDRSRASRSRAPDNDQGSSFSGFSNSFSSYVQRPQQQQQQPQPQPEPASVSALREEKSRLEVDTKNATMRANEAEAQNVVLAKEVLQLKEQIRIMAFTSAKRNVALERQVRDAKAEEASVLMINGFLKTSVASSETSITLFERRIAAQQSINADLEKAIAESKGSNAALRSTIDTLEKQNAKSANELKALRVELNELKRVDFKDQREKDLVSAASALRAENASLRERLAEALGENASLKKINDSKDERLVLQKDTIERSTRLHATMTAELAASRKNFHDKNEELTRCRIAAQKALYDCRDRLADEKKESVRLDAEQKRIDEQLGRNLQGNARAQLVNARAANVERRRQTGSRVTGLLTAAAVLVASLFGGAGGGQNNAIALPDILAIAPVVNPGGNVTLPFAQPLSSPPPLQPFALQSDLRPLNTAQDVKAPLPEQDQNSAAALIFRWIVAPWLNDGIEVTQNIANAVSNLAQLVPPPAPAVP